MINLDQNSKSLVQCVFWRCLFFFSHVRCLACYKTLHITRCLVNPGRKQIEALVWNEFCVFSFTKWFQLWWRVLWAGSFARGLMSIITGRWEITPLVLWLKYAEVSAPRPMLFNPGSHRHFARFVSCDLSGSTWDIPAFKPVQSFSWSLSPFSNYH